MDYTNELRGQIEKKYGISGKVSSLILNEVQNFSELLDVNKFEQLFSSKKSLIANSSIAKVELVIKQEKEKELLMGSGHVFVKKMKKNELGLRTSGGRAGSFALIPKQIADSFFNNIPLPKHVLNPKIEIDIYDATNKIEIDGIYDYHNSKIINNDPSGRDEYRLYSSFFRTVSPDDVLLVVPSNSSDEDKYKFVFIHIPQGAIAYNNVLELISQYRVGRSDSALVPILELFAKGISYPSFFDVEPPKGKEIEKNSTSSFSGVSENDLQQMLSLLLETGEIERAVVVQNKIVRNRKFRKVVLSLYENQCAITGHRIGYGATLNIQAAHIKGKSEGGSDNATNGIPFSMDLHWAFDRGYFTIDEEYVVQVHDEIMKLGQLEQINRKKIILPNDEKHWPSQEMLGFHRENIFGMFLNTLS